MAQLVILQLTQERVAEMREKPVLQRSQVLVPEQDLQLDTLQVTQAPSIAENPVLQITQTFSELQV